MPKGLRSRPHKFGPNTEQRGPHQGGLVPDDLDNEAPSSDGLTRLAELTRGILHRLSRPEYTFALAAWPPAIPRRRIKPCALPVLRWLVELAQTAPDFSSQLVGELADIGPALAWRQSYAVPLVTQAFLDNYGWTELVGPRGVFPASVFACGFLLLGPSTFYPSHHHEAYELYVPLAGVASWQRGDRAWQPEKPGSLVIHASGEPHAMQTGTSALLALYLWRSNDLLQSAKLN